MRCIHHCKLQKVMPKFCEAFVFFLFRGNKENNTELVISNWKANNEKTNRPNRVISIQFFTLICCDRACLLPRRSVISSFFKIFVQISFTVSVFLLAGSWQLCLVFTCHQHSGDYFFISVWVVLTFWFFCRRKIVQYVCEFNWSCVQVKFAKRWCGLGKRWEQSIFVFISTRLVSIDFIWFGFVLLLLRRFVNGRFSPSFSACDRYSKFTWNFTFICLRSASISGGPFFVARILIEYSLGRFLCQSGQPSRFQCDWAAFVRVCIAFVSNCGHRLIF